MKLKVSEYTPFFLIGLVIVLIVRHFYNPLQMPDFWEIYEKNDPVVSVTAAQVILSICAPVMMSMIDFMSYMGEFMISIRSDKFVVLFVAGLICVGYLLITFFLEKFHTHWHEEEGAFAMCIDMLCVENIVMYLFNLAFYGLSRVLAKSGIPDEIFMLLFLLIVLPTLWGILFYLSYILVGIVVSFGVPVLGVVLLTDIVGETAAAWLMLILIIVFSQVVWRLCSGKIYNALLKQFSFHHMSLE